MFENPGGKIKGLAVASVVVEALGSFIMGIVLWEDLEALALLIMLGGILVAYATALLLYGFGELVESTAQTRDLLLEAGEWEEKLPKARPAVQKTEKPALLSP